MHPISYIQIAALVRISALNTAGRLMEIGPPKPDGRFWSLTEEFLAFYSMMACRFIYMVFEINDPEEIQKLYPTLTRALRDNLNDKLDSDMVSYKVDDYVETMIFDLTLEKSFNNEFWALWHADLDALRITLNYLGELAKIGMAMPSEDKTDIACFAMIVRSARKDVSGGKDVLDTTAMPSIENINSCGKVFSEEGRMFNEAMNIILLNDFKRSA